MEDIERDVDKIAASIELKPIYDHIWKPSTYVTTGRELGTHDVYKCSKCGKEKMFKTGEEKILDGCSKPHPTLGEVEWL